MSSLFAESSSSSAVLCAPRPRRVHVHPCSADLILGPPPFLLNSSGDNKKVLTGPNPLKNNYLLLLLQNFIVCFSFARIYVWIFYLTKLCSFLLQQREGKSKARDEEDEDEEGGGGGWALFGGSPPARADNPLVHDPHFLLNQRHHAAAASDISLAVFDSHRNNHHVTTYSNSHSFAPSYAPAVRIQGFDVASCRSSHGSSGGSRVLSARA
ncbi:unnamed protein product [Alopecurus aequalis]